MWFHAESGSNRCLNALCLRDMLSNRGRDEAIQVMAGHVETCHGFRGHVFRDQRFLSRLNPADKKLAARRIRLFLWLRLCSGFRLAGVEEKDGLQPRAPLGLIEALIRFEMRGGCVAYGYNRVETKSAASTMCSKVDEH